MTTASIMTTKLFTLKPDDTVADALQLMHSKHVRNLPVVDESGDFVGLFGLHALSRILLPIAASDFGRYSIADLRFLPDETLLVSDRWNEVADQPVMNFLEKRKKLRFCTPETRLPDLLAMFDSTRGMSMPVIVLHGQTSRLVGMISAWDVLNHIVLGCLVNNTSNENSSADD